MRISILSTKVPNKSLVRAGTDRFDYWIMTRHLLGASDTCQPQLRYKNLGHVLLRVLQAQIRSNFSPDETQIADSKPTTIVSSVLRQDFHICSISQTNSTESEQKKLQRLLLLLRFLQKKNFLNNKRDRFEPENFMICIFIQLICVHSEEEMKKMLLLSIVKEKNLHKKQRARNLFLHSRITLLFPYFYNSIRL